MQKPIKWICLILCVALALSLLPPTAAKAANTEEPEIPYYGRYALSTMERADAYLYAYDQITAGVEETTEAIDVFNDKDYLSRDELTMIVNVYQSDHGEHFWFGNSYSYSMSSQTVYLVFPNYTMTGAQLTQAKQKFQERAGDILSGINPSMTEFEKELYIHDMLVDRNTYDYGSNCYTAYGALVDGVSVCDGYAKAFQYLLMCAGIQSYRVTGYANGGPHAWNYVRIDGKYYQTDPTWNDSGDGGYYSYFNLTDREMGADHAIDPVAYPLPVCDSEEADYYKMTGKVLEAGNISVEKFAQLLLAGDMSMDVSYNGADTELSNWFYDHLVEVSTLANIHDYFSYAYGGRNGTVTIRIVGINATVVKNGQIHYYADVERALENCDAGSILRLREDLTESVTITQKLILDLNGYDITGNITGAENLHIMDSQTDDYYVNDTAGYGVISGTAVGAEPLDGYVAVEESSGISYHKVDAALTKVNLKIADVGIYYTAKFRYDDVVAKYLDTVGVTLSVAGENPVADDSDPASRYTTANNSVLVKNIMSVGADNTSRAKMLIYARAYLKLSDGTFIYGRVSATNLQTLVETVDAKSWTRLSDAQKGGIADMYAAYAETMSTWKIPNLKAYCA